MTTTPIFTRTASIDTHTGSGHINPYPLSISHIPQPDRNNRRGALLVEVLYREPGSTAWLPSNIWIPVSVLTTGHGRNVTMVRADIMHRRVCEAWRGQFVRPSNEEVVVRGIRLWSRSGG